MNDTLARRKIGLADHHNKDRIVTQAKRWSAPCDLVQLRFIYQFALARPLNGPFSPLELRLIKPSKAASAVNPEATSPDRTGASSPASAVESTPSDLPQDFETALAQLEALVAQMESGELPLEESLAAYRRGVALTRVCQERLSQAEQQINVLEAGLLRPFDATDRQSE